MHENLIRSIRDKEIERKRERKKYRGRGSVNHIYDITHREKCAVDCPYKCNCSYLTASYL
jgi:predicted transcriptional regulator